MLAPIGWGRDTMENASMRGIGKAITAGAIMIITGTGTVAAITIVMTGINLPSPVYPLLMAFASEVCRECPRR
jgi:hypothetical protein